jgi:hypothetical protein
MPMDYYCQACGLVFSVGTYGIPGNKYMLRTLLVCRNCGTAYEHQQSSRDSVPDRVVTLGEPLVREKQPERPTLVDRRLKWKECSLGDDQGVVEDFVCEYCGKKGVLTSRPPKEKGACPRCSGNTLINSFGWIT